MFVLPNFQQQQAGYTCLQCSFYSHLCPVALAAYCFCGQQWLQGTKGSSAIFCWQNNILHSRAAKNAAEFAPGWLWILVVSWAGSAFLCNIKHAVQRGTLAKCWVTTKVKFLSAIAVSLPVKELFAKMWLNQGLKFLVTCLRDFNAFPGVTLSSQWPEFSCMLAWSKNWVPSLWVVPVCIKAWEHNLKSRKQCLAVMLRRCIVRQIFTHAIIKGRKPFLIRDAVSGTEAGTLWSVDAIKGSRVAVFHVVCYVSALVF